ncbi:hypothetical protein [Williamsia sterculiae]|uniref:Uncharacterized protein n=1 Tax=Williamsia sterculiae TaxID=1344003 RepID=A0A1N7HE36_9NOCA|nr:hypothetical protein [Williamsia sterculiae]SIS23125.1 hypothetical protein SAMN05445060_4059 [Williamsia sterculiae]
MNFSELPTVSYDHKPDGTIVSTTRRFDGNTWVTEQHIIIPDRTTGADR